MSTRSKFERQLDFKPYGFSVKIPDAGLGYKPFDYIVGIPVKATGGKILRFVAIEAKKADGWTLGVSKWRPHQRTALNLVEKLAPYSSWVAIGFLDIPKMTLDHNRKRIDGKRKKEAFLLWWEDYLCIEGERSCRYADIIEQYPNSVLEWRKIGKKYAWTIPQGHEIFRGYRD